MRRSLLGLFCFVFALPALSQAPPADTTGAWVQTAVGGLSLTQAQYDNWTGGGENTTAFKGQIKYGAVGGTTVQQTHEAEFAFGQSRVGDQDWRKVDDLIRYVFKLGYPLNGNEEYQPVFTVDARTQIANGFDYSTEDDVLISKFLAPAFITESAGFQYKPAPWAQARLGLAARQTIVTDEDLRDPDNPAFEFTNGYGNDPDQTLRFEAGLDLNVSAEREIFENVLLNSELSVFESFQDLSNPDIRWKNLFTFGVNRYLNATFEFEAFYDRDQSEDLQIRQVLSLGLSYTLL